jgi:hypothetical protein
VISAFRLRTCKFVSQNPKWHGSEFSLRKSLEQVTNESALEMRERKPKSWSRMKLVSQLLRSEHGGLRPQASSAGFLSVENSATLIGAQHLLD